MKRIITSILMILLLVSSALAVYAEQSEPGYEGGIGPTVNSADPSVYVAPDDTITANRQWDIKGELKEGELEVFEHNNKKYEVMLEDFSQEDDVVILKWNVNGNKLNMKIEQEPYEIYPPAYKLPATASNSYFTVQVVDMELSAKNDYAEYYQRPQVAFYMKFKEPLPPVPGDYFQDTFEVGQTRQYEWKNREYEITLLGVDNNNIDPYEDADSEYKTGMPYKMPTARFMINGIVTKWLYDGQKQELTTEDGRNIGTLKILDVGIKQAEFQFYPRLTPEPANNWIYVGETKVFDQYSIEYEVTLGAIKDNVALLTINGVRGEAVDGKRTTIGKAAVTVDVKSNGVYVTYIGAAPVIPPTTQKFTDWLFEGQTKWYETQRQRFGVEVLEIDGNEVVLRVNNDKLAIAEGDFQRTETYGIKIMDIIDQYDGQGTDKPKVELFVMSHCPFGTQMEKGIIPVVETLGNTIDFEVKFVNYAMHGEKEVYEQLNQYCIQEEQNNKFLPYLECFLKAGDGERCLERVGVDIESLKECAKETDKKFDITENWRDEDNWLSGRFPKFMIYNRENERYEIKGSPTLVINGEQVQSSRDPASLLATICGAFKEKPEECKTRLSTTTPEPGFGEIEYVTSSDGEHIDDTTARAEEVYLRDRVHFTLYVYGQATDPPVVTPTCTDSEPCTNMPYPEEDEPECTEANPCFAPNPYGDDSDQDNDVQTQDVSCTTGCTHDGACLPVGTRVANGKALYCEYTKQMQEQKTNEQTCQNNYECESNQCLSGTCQSLDKEIQKTQGMLEKLFNWLGNIF